MLWCSKSNNDMAFSCGWAWHQCAKSCIELTIKTIRSDRMMPITCTCSKWYTGCIVNMRLKLPTVWTASAFATTVRAYLSSSMSNSESLLVASSLESSSFICWRDTCRWVTSLNWLNRQLGAQANISYQNISHKHYSAITAALDITAALLCHSPKYRAQKPR